MAKVPTTYECPACQRRFAITTMDLGPAAMTAAAPARAAELLRHATCPGCGARNPEGVAVQRRSALQNRAITAASHAAFALLAVWVPWVALFIPVLSLLFVGIGLIARRRHAMPIIPWRVAVSVVVAAAMLAFVLVVPALAFVVPGAAAVYTACVPGAPDDHPFTDAAARLRLETSPYRG